MTAPDDLAAQKANDAYLAGLADLLCASRDSTWQVQASMVTEYAHRYDPAFLAYGREQATRAAEQALRDAAAFIRGLEGEYIGRLGSDTLAARADELRRQA